MRYKYPLHAVWITTNLCNAKCQHCSTGASGKLDQELSTEEAMILLDEFSELGVFDIAFSGGEPILRRDIFDLLEYAIDRGLRVGIGTNGLVISKKMVERLSEIGVSRVQVSLDGAIPETHDSIRGVLTCFEHAVNAIRLCKESVLKTKVCFTANALNYQQLNGVIDLCLKLRVDCFNMSRFVPIGRGSQSLDLSPQQWKEVLSVYVDRKRKHLKKMQFFTQEAQLILVEPELKKVPSFVGCQAGGALCCVSATGFVYPCVLFPMPLGNIRERSFKEIWTKSYIIRQLENRNNLKGKCKSCEYQELCGGCRGAAYAYTNDFLAEDPRCWLSSSYSETLCQHEGSDAKRS